MANDVAKFGIGLNFQQALAGVKKLKAEVRSLNNMQTQMNRVRRTANPARGGSSNTPRMAGHDRAMERSTNSERMRVVEAERSLLRDRLAAEIRASRTRARQAPQNSSSSRSSRPSSNPETEALREGNRERARALRLQEQLGAAMNRDTNAALSSERARVRALERAREAISNSAMMTRRASNAAERLAQANIRSALATETSVTSLRRVVALERAALASTRSRSFLMQRMEASSRNMAGNMVSAFAVAGVTTGIVKLGQEFDSINNTMTSVSTGADGINRTTENLKFASDEAERLGINYRDASSSFAKMVAAKGEMSLDQTKDVFSGLSENIAVLGLSTDRAKMSMVALQQMMSKGKITAEELKQQMGDHLPSAIPLMAKAAQAAGVSVSGTVDELFKLMENGKLLSSEILPHFATELHKAAQANGALEKAMVSNKAEMNRMINSYENAANIIFDSGMEEGLTSLFKSIADLFKDNGTFFKSFGKIAGAFFKGLAFLVDNVLNPVLSALGSILNLVTTAMEKLGDWVAIVLVYFAKFTPLVGSAIKMMGGFKGVFSVLGTLARGILLPFTLILGVLEEIAEFFAPTGKKTLIGFNINDIKFPDMPTWLTDAFANKGNSVSNGAGLPSYLTTPKVNYGGYGTQPITVQTDLHMNDEVIATAVSKTNALNSTIDSKIAESNSYNH